MRYFNFLILFSTLSYNSHAIAFPQYGSLAGLSGVELAEILLTLQAPSELPPLPDPLPPNDSGAKLVNNAEHPYVPPGPGDIRGPCPGLNTLANHGYIPHNGVASPSQVLSAVQEGFNMGNDMAIAQAYGIHLLNGNLVTDLMSIGGRTPLTGPRCPGCKDGGLSDHTTFEGDASLTRADLYFGDNESFNETIFQEFVHFSSKSYDGKYDIQVAADFRLQRYKESIATNPEFDYGQTRCFQAATEAALGYTLLVDGRTTGPGNVGRLDMESARSFFQFGRFPPDFHRANHPSTLREQYKELIALLNIHPEVKPGKNNGAVNSFIPDPELDQAICPGYEEYVHSMVYSYPNASGALLKALNHNLDILYTGFHRAANCTQVYPFGKPS